MSPRKTSEASRSEAQKTKQPHLESDEDSRPTLRPALWATSPNSVVGERLIADPGVKPPWLGAEKLGVVLGVFKGLTRKRCLEEVFPENRCFCGLEEMFFKEEHRTCYVVFSKRVGYISFSNAGFRFLPLTFFILWLRWTPRLVFVGIYSARKNFEKRSAVRAAWAGEGSGGLSTAFW